MPDIEIFRRIKTSPATRKTKILAKSNIFQVLKNQFIYFGLLFSFLAIMLLPIVEMMPHVTHRHLEIGASGYR